ncbi:unnamed protein product [Neospora caninum Liverpool]|uniref:AP2 domain transcription factor AP2X-11 n=1 Tax=Neospora caninum (strain Liverpool) TaxID=572307 RepID=F0VL71_NEOCL|nr:uncharacterized protein NCLIV_052490 [Neospora caninum Liverpool]CBZ54823.1 unnamed protein product [Neospora caninum Liverpool]CEL69542.1 TPA: AP2 domain transcription factor AP2X-11 [Neospora caninum Liverpool]|eukprot:XP_003884851.1 uncharacterized protein NCLIV_052490 [Neospora caninum Liverpool]
MQKQTGVCVLLGGNAPQRGPRKRGGARLHAEEGEQGCASPRPGDALPTAQGVCEESTGTPLAFQEHASGPSSTITPAAGSWDALSAGTVARLPPTAAAASRSPSTLCGADARAFPDSLVPKDVHAPHLDELSGDCATATAVEERRPACGDNLAAEERRGKEPQVGTVEANGRVERLSGSASGPPSASNQADSSQARHPAAASDPVSSRLASAQPSFSLRHALSLPQPLGPSSDALESTDTTPTSSFSPASLSRLAGVSPKSVPCASLAPEQQLAVATESRAGGCRSAEPPTLDPSTVNVDVRSVFLTTLDGASPFESPLRDCSQGSSYTRASSTLSLSPESAAKRRKTNNENSTCLSGNLSPGALLNMLALSLAPGSSPVSNPQESAVPGASGDSPAGSLASLSSPAPPSRSALDSAGAPAESLSAVHQLEAALLASASAALPTRLSPEASFGASLLLNCLPGSLVPPVPAAPLGSPKPVSGDPRDRDSTLDVAAALALVQNPGLLADLRRGPGNAAERFPPRPAPRQDVPQTGLGPSAHTPEAAGGSRPADLDTVQRGRGSRGRQNEKGRSRGASRGVAVAAGGAPAEDFAARARQCEHVPGVCFDRWNQGWIATWREQRHPVHKHFSAKKYGFERARALAIEHRRLMVSRHRQNGESGGGAVPGASPAGARPRDSVHMPSSEGNATGSRAMASPQVPDGSPSGGCRADGAAGPVGCTDTAGEAPGEPARRPKFGCPRAATAAAGGRRPCLGEKAGKREMSWAELVASMPRVERVSFDFTNQSWIAQWKQQGCTTYRRFSVSKFGFFGAHHLAVEFKRQNYRQLPSQKTTLPDSPAPLAAVSPHPGCEAVADEKASSGRAGGSAKRALSHCERGRRLPRGASFQRAASLTSEAGQNGKGPIPALGGVANACSGAPTPACSPLQCVGASKPVASAGSGEGEDLRGLGFPSLASLPACSLFGLSPSAFSQVLSPLLGDGVSGTREAPAQNSGLEVESSLEAGSTKAPSGALSPVLDNGQMCAGGVPCPFVPAPSPTEATTRVATDASSSSACLPLGVLGAGSGGQGDASLAVLTSKLRALPAPTADAPSDSQRAHPRLLSALLSSSPSFAFALSGESGAAQRGQGDETGGSASPFAPEKPDAPGERAETSDPQAWRPAEEPTVSFTASAPAVHTSALEERGKSQGGPGGAARVASVTTTTSPHDEESSASPGWLGTSNAFAFTDAVQAGAPRPSTGRVSPASAAPAEAHALPSAPINADCPAAGALPLYKFALCCMLADLKTNCLGSVFSALSQTPSPPASLWTAPYLDLLDVHTKRVTEAADLKQLAAYGSVFDGFLKASVLPSACAATVQAKLLHALATMDLPRSGQKPRAPEVLSSRAEKA